jgi:hypothetical protein
MAEISTGWGRLRGGLLLAQAFQFQGRLLFERVRTRNRLRLKMEPTSASVG